MNRDNTDTILNTLVFGQLFVDDLEKLEEDKSIFKQGLKHWARKTMEELRRKVDLLFNSMDSEGSQSVAHLYDVNLYLLRKINSLSIEEKYALYNQFDEIRNHIKVNENETVD